MSPTLPFSLQSFLYEFFCVHVETQLLEDSCGIKSEGAAAFRKVPHAHTHAAKVWRHMHSGERTLRSIHKSACRCFGGSWLAEARATLWLAVCAVANQREAALAVSKQRLRRSRGRRQAARWTQLRRSEHREPVVSSLSVELWLMGGERTALRSAPRHWMGISVQSGRRLRKREI